MLACTRTVLILFTTLVTILSRTHGSRILAVFPTPCISHQRVFRPLTQELVKRGHEVVVITTDPMYPRYQTPPNLTEIDLHDISYLAKENILNGAMKKNRSPLAQIMKITELFSELIELQFKTKEFQRILRNNNTHYDLLIIEAWVRPMLVLSHVFKAPVIQLSSFAGLVYNYEALGVPVHPIRFPTFIHQKIHSLSLWDKIKEVHTFMWFKYIVTKSEKAENAMLRRIFGTNVPTVAELSNNIDLLLLNNYPMWAGNIPVPPNVVYIGGIYRGVKQILTEDLKSFLDSSKNGVIYFSLGTNVKSSQIPRKSVQVMLNVFSRLPYDILLKWDDDELPEKLDNAMISKWFPQSNLLTHPKIKLFITQGGLQSTEEAIAAGVPLIGIPFYGDQWYNVEKYEQFDVGVKFNINSITEEELHNAIVSVIEDERYRQNMVRLRSLMYDQPQRPLDRAVWWTEHVLRQGGAKHLRSPTANISWAEYLEIEVLAIVAIFFLSLCILFIWLLNCFLRYILYTLANVKLKQD